MIETSSELGAAGDEPRFSTGDSGPASKTWSDYAFGGVRHLKCLGKLSDGLTWLDWQHPPRFGTWLRSRA